MRRFSFALLVGTAAFAFSASATEAQTIGFKLGASMSKLSIEGTTQDTDWNTKFMGGGFVRFGFGRLGIQPELLYVTKGAKMTEDDGTGEEFEMSLDVDYIAIPVMLHLPLTSGSSFTPYLMAGPEFAFEMGCELSAEGLSVDCDEGEGFERKSFDMGIGAGGGFAFAMGPGALLFEGRWTHGMTNLLDTDVEDESAKNRSLYITAGYSIPLGRR
jgi:hypothetical protein